MRTLLVFLISCSSMLLVEANRGQNYDNGMSIWNVTDPLENETEGTTAAPNRPRPSIHVASWNYEYVKPYLITTLFLIIVTICKLGFHKAETLSSIVPESCLLVVLGTAVGGFFYAIKIDPEKFHLTPEVFFLILLPPIILESAYSLHDRVFFHNLGTVLLYAVIGSILNAFLLGLILYGLAIGGAMGPISITVLQCLVFSSLIVAVDPVAVLAIFQEISVNNVLYFLVFGESLLNDAVTVVIYNTMKTFDQMDTIPPSQIALGFAAFFSVSLGGLAIGLLVGVFTSFLTKYTHDVRIVEPLAVYVLAYGAYILAELFHFSGIISIIGCGLVQAQYAFHNISMKALTTVTYFSKTISTTSDCIIFMFLGMALVRDTHVWHTGFVLWTLLLCLVLRFIVVYSLTFLANLVRVRKIDLEEQFIMAYGGLRGAVAFSLAAMLNPREVEHKELFMTTTLVVIIATVFIQGITIKPFVKLFRIRRSGGEVASMYQEVNTHATDYLMAAIEEIIGTKGQNTFREWLIDKDQKYFKKWLQRNPQTRDNAIMQMHQQITMQLHYENLQKGGGEKYKYQSFIYDDDGQMDLYPLPEGLGTLAESDEEIRENYVRRILDSREEEERKRRSIEIKRQRTATLPQVSLRRRLMTRSHMGQSSSQDNEKRRSSEMTDEVDIPHLRRVFAKNPNIYRQRGDRNLKHDDEHDLLHLLYEKRRRTQRMLSMGISPASSFSGDPFGRSGSPPPGQPARRYTMDVIREKPTEKSATVTNNNEKPVKRQTGGRGFLQTRRSQRALQTKSASVDHPMELSHQTEAPKHSKNAQTPLLATNIPITDQSDQDSDSPQAQSDDITTHGRSEPRPPILRQGHVQPARSREDTSEPIRSRDSKSSSKDVSESNV